MGWGGVLYKSITPGTEVAPDHSSYKKTELQGSESRGDSEDSHVDMSK